MGDIADDIIEGFQCSCCGICFEDAHGYPVVCRGCWNDMSPKEREDYQKAALDEL